MRICLASIHPRMLSGQIESLVALARALRAAGHSVRVVSAFPEAQLNHGARWSLDAADGHALPSKLVRVWQIVRDVCREARGADVVQLNLPTPAFSVIADLVRAVARCPVVVGFEAHLASLRTLAGAGHIWRAPRFYLPRAAINNGLVARLTLHGCEGYVVSSQWQRHELQRLGFDADRVAVIPNPVDTVKLRRWPRDEARRRLGLPPSARFVVYAGHYHPVKGMELLPLALRKVLATVSEAYLVLAWSGLGDWRVVDRAVEHAGVRDRVIELGRVDVAQVMSAADVVAAPYTLTIGQAAYPAVPLEAIHLGVPLVTSDLPLLRELTRGEAALLVEPGSVPALAAGLITLLTEPDRSARLCAAQALLRDGVYHPDKLALRYDALYQAALGRQAGVLQPALGQR